MSPYNSLYPWLIGTGINGTLLMIALRVPKKLLTPAGYIHGCILGIVTWGCMGWQGYGIVLVYFFIGSVVTRIGMSEKEASGIAEKRAGLRGPENVWGSALIATLCAIGIFVIPWLSLGDNQTPWKIMLTLGFVASYSTKLADTCASEVGKAYGQRTFLITTFQPVPKGTEGAVSLEGTMAGVMGAIVLSTIAWLFQLIDVSEIPLCIIAAFIATTIESVVGATLQTRYIWLSNELVNVLNTLIGAWTAICLGLLKGT